MSALATFIELHAASPLYAASDDSSAWLLLAGPFAGIGIYWGLYRYYRNTDKSHDFERETRVDSQPPTGSDVKIGELRRTKASGIPGNNRSSHRERVNRVK